MFEPRDITPESIGFQGCAVAAGALSWHQICPTDDLKYIKAKLSATWLVWRGQLRVSEGYKYPNWLCFL
jgi:hypothetical protein